MLQRNPLQHVTLVPDELAKLEKYTQLKLKTRSEQDTFDEPCVLHTGTHCSAYDDRPGTCERYVCGVLRAVGKEEMTEDEALLVIKEGRALVDHVKEFVAFEPGMPIAVSTWDAAPEGISAEARFAWDQTAYHLGKFFLGTVKEEVEPALQTAPPSGSPERAKVTRASLFAKR